MRTIAVVLLALMLAGTASASRADDASRFLIQQRNADAGFGEPGRGSTPGLTAWAILGLRAAGHCPERSGDYLRNKPYPTATDLELRILALDALRDGCRFTANLGPKVRQLQSLRKADGRIGKTVNSTIWGVIALRAVERPAGKKTRRWLLARQRSSGGWPWSPGGEADSNDTAAAIQALVASGVGKRSRPIDRGVRFLRRLQNRDGGFELRPGRGSDTQSTAWAIQALLAADRDPGPKAFGYVRRMQRSNGSFRYNKRFATTPVWVTSQALAALVRKPFPLK